MSKNTIGNLSAEILISNNQVTGKATKLYNKGTKHYAVLEDGTEYVFTNEYISRLDEGQSSTYEPTVGNERRILHWLFQSTCGICGFGNIKELCVCS